MNAPDTGFRARLSRRSFVLIDTANLLLAALYVSTAAANIATAGCGGTGGPFPFFGSIYVAYLLARGARSLSYDFPDQAALAAHHRDAVQRSSSAFFGAALLAMLPMMTEFISFVDFILTDRAAFGLYAEFSGASWKLHCVLLALIAADSIRAGSARSWSRHAFSYGVGALSIIAHFMASVVNSFAGGCLPSEEAGSWLAIPLGAGLGLTLALRNVGRREA